MNNSTQKYHLSNDDMRIIKMYNKDKHLSENAEKTLTILSCTFGGLHHVDSDQLELFEYSSKYENSYLVYEELATYDFSKLTTLVILSHEMAVRVAVKSIRLNPCIQKEYDLMQKIHKSYNSDQGNSISFEEFYQGMNPYTKLSFCKRERNGDFSQRHPTINDSVNTVRENFCDE
jgi:hypothetical protein